VIAASHPVQRRHDARLLVIDAQGILSHTARADLLGYLQSGDLVVANDAATLPASLHGLHAPSSAPIEVRLAARSSLRRDDTRFFAVVFGAGDWRTRTEDRPPPPELAAGDRLALGPLAATIEAILDHPRLVALRFDGPPPAVWAGHGRPIQYAYMDDALALWDVWTPIAALPVAFEPPSAGFALDWRTIGALRGRGVGFATLTLAAGISSTGDAGLDARLPLDEPYRIPEATAAALRRTKAKGGRVVAVGTTVVRALEHAGARTGTVAAGDGVANQRIDAYTWLRVVDAMLTGTHEPRESHYQLLRAFQDDATLERASTVLEAQSYRTHEFGDSVLVARRQARRIATRPSVMPASHTASQKLASMA
jgi:S-adenosylmethionine:tRNA ribosyltransferase-isomerase